MHENNKLSNIKTFIYDFDGVMTDNKVIVSSDGSESVVCNRSDGLAVSLIKHMNIHQCILSTETNVVVKKRAEKLKINCIQGSVDKKSNLLEYAEANSLLLKEIAYIGNDINDINAMRLVGVKIAPKDASVEILSIADIVTDAAGGEGVIYEIYKKYLAK